MKSRPEEERTFEPRGLAKPLAQFRSLRAATIIDRALAIALVAIGIVALASVGLVVVAHLHDTSGLDSPAGTWIALAHYLNDGTFYPPLYDGHAFGGTRYMPLSFALLAGIERVTGDYMVAGKVLSLVMMVVLLAVTFWVLRRERAPIPVAVALAGTLATCSTGVTAATYVRNDALPVILQVLAVALVARASRPWTFVAAGAVCALALAAKTSALWATIAVGVWLAFRNRAALFPFFTGFLVSVAGVFGLVEAVSGGRFARNVVELSNAGHRGTANPGYVFRAYVEFVHAGLGPVRLLLAVAAGSAVVAFWRRTASIYQVALGGALLVLIPVFADVGAVSNHLLDVAVVAILVVGGLWANVVAPSPRAALLRRGLALCVLVVAAATFAGSLSVLHVREAARELTGSAETPKLRVLLAPYVRRGDRILSEDPNVPEALGQHPVVLDPFILLTLAQTHHAWQDDLVRRLQAHEFDEIFLTERPETAERSAPVRFRYDNLDFGRPIADAIVRNYRAVGTVGRIWVYRPRSEH